MELATGTELATGRNRDLIKKGLRRLEFIQYPLHVRVETET